MISSNEALKVVLANARNFGVEKVGIHESLGRILAEDIIADRDFPPFNRVMMDGIAVKYRDVENGLTEFIVEGTQYAGMSQLTCLEPGKCMEVMTGAMLPDGLDSVIKFEDLRSEQGQKVEIFPEKVKKGQHVHDRGMDRKKGEMIVKAGVMIGPAEIAVLSTVGSVDVQVIRQPAIAIVTTGDELVDVSSIPEPHQIRSSNSIAVNAALIKRGYVKTSMHHINDEPEVMERKMNTLLHENDMIILSGGVSRGKKDFVPDILNRAGVQKEFHKVAQRPGKPFWFGQKGEKVVFALPGNPVSTFMCFHKYVVPWLEVSAGISVKKEYAILDEDFDFEPDLTYFLQVKLYQGDDGAWMARPVPGQGSGDLANLVDASAFLELPSNQSHFSKGEKFPLLRYGY